MDSPSRFLSHLLIGIAALLATSCAKPEPRSGSGSERPTFVSLNPCLDAILIEVATDEQILALSHYSRDPSSSSIDVDRARQFAMTGGTAEEVIALDPDIVLASSFIAPATRAAFERLGMRVETFESPTTVEESVAQVRRLAELTGEDLLGEWLVQDIERSWIAMHRPQISTLLWQPGQIVPGQETLIDELLDRNGFSSQSQAMGLGQADYVSLESILANPPELLLVAGSSAGQTHPSLARLQDTRVETLDPRLLYCGARTIVGVQMRLDEIRADMDR